MKQRRILTYKPFSDALQIETKIVRQWKMSHNAIAFLLNLFETCGPHIACKLRTNPTIFKRVSGIYTQLLPTLTRLEDTRLQCFINVVKTHRAKVDIFHYQMSAGDKVAAHSSECCYWLGEILADIGTKNEVYTSIRYWQLLQKAPLVLDHSLVPFPMQTFVSSY